MKIEDYGFIGMMFVFCIISVIFKIIPTDHKLHIDEQMGICFITNAGRNLMRYDGSEFEFSTGEELFLPKLEDDMYSSYDHSVLIMVKNSQEGRIPDIINNLMEKKYIREDRYSVVLLPYDLNLSELEHVTVTEVSNPVDPEMFKKIKKYDLKHVPLIDEN